jgi:RimJ/RimL family protein N-acetyltransferase
VIVETRSEDYAALRAGSAPRDFRLADTAIAPPEIIEMLSGVAAKVRETFSPVSWLIVENGELVGLCSVTRPPVHGVIEIGYGVAPSWQNRGIAKRAIGEIVKWAICTPHVVAISADTAPNNAASQRVLQDNGFDLVGERLDDEDGRLICWRCSTV